MNKKCVERIESAIEKIEQSGRESNIKYFDPGLQKRIAARLASFECKECDAHLESLCSYVETLLNSQFDHKDIRQYKKKVVAILLHLQKRHGLVQKDYYIGVFMSMGMSVGAGLGLVFGILNDGNMVLLGLPIGAGLGLSFGVAIGAAKDAEAKKKGLVI